MNKKEIVKILEEIGTILDLKGENPFKSRAYFNAARTIETISDDVIELVKSGDIAKVKGIGKAISEKLGILVGEGRLPYYDDLKASIPAGLFEMLDIPGLGPKKVKAVYDKLGIASIGELEYACLENRLRDLQGFGSKSQDKILQGIALRKKYRERFHFHIAYEEAQKIMAYMDEHPAIIRIELAGSLRRKKETVKDIDIVASCSDAQRTNIMEYFCGYNDIDTITGQGQTKSSIVLESGIGCDLRLVSDEQFPFTLHHFTGSKEHNTALRQRAKSMNLTMNEYGLFGRDSEQTVVCADEEEIFRTLDLPFIPAVLRENYGEIEAADEDKLPDLIRTNQIQGLFHVHTTYSDGAATIKEMVERCKQIGLTYLGISDHSKSAFYANGLQEERILLQHEEIDRLNAELNDFTIFKGIEADILPDGSMDYSDEILATFDFVIASVHSSFKMSEEDMTARICRALNNPYVTMLGHPSGRLILGREPYPHNMGKIIETAAENGKIIEINANPHRLDLDWRWGKLANSKGVKTAINPDAHSPDGLEDFRLGVGIAQKGWFATENVVNFYGPQQVADLFKNISGKK